jgi:DnaJ-class molecular chaperone
MKLNLILLLLVMSLAAQAQKENIRKTATFRGNPANRVLVVDNIHGDVVVEASPGDQVVLEAEKTITAKDPADVTKGMRELQVQMTESNDTIYVYLEAPFIQRKKGPHFNGRGQDIHYRFHVDLTLKVPDKVQVVAATVNEGEVRVSQVQGPIKARNVNGGITLTGVRGPVDAHTVNGSIHVTYTTDTPPAADFKTINGKVEVYHPGRLHGNLSFKSMHGEFFTDLQDLERQPAKVVRHTSQQGSNTTYKINERQSYKAGKGGAELSFETLNGNIYLKKK